MNMKYEQNTQGIHQLQVKDTLQKERRSIQDVLLLYKLVNGIIDCPDLLQKINFQIPTGTRSRVLFARTSVTTSNAANILVIRMQRLGCLLPEHMDLFYASLASFNRALCASQCLNTRL
ncbi:hypothetical protein J6590_087015 [Homalodisca vitripennis]|nr:hypothetical protein J6590_087015 [Homalodisca vitripennis]